MNALLPLVVIFALIWLFMIRPQMRRQRAARDLQSQLSVGDHVMLTSGIYAEVSGIGTDYVLVQLAEDVVVRVSRPAVLRVLSHDDLVKGGLAEPIEGDEGADSIDEPAVLPGTVVESSVDEEGDDTTSVTGDEPDAPAEEKN